MTEHKSKVLDLGCKSEESLSVPVVPRESGEDRRDSNTTQRGVFTLCGITRGVMCLILGMAVRWLGREGRSRCQAEEIELTKPEDRESMVCPHWGLQGVVCALC